MVPLLIIATGNATLPSWRSSQHDFGRIMGCQKMPGRSALQTGVRPPTRLLLCGWSIHGFFRPPANELRFQGKTAPEPAGPSLSTEKTSYETHGLVESGSLSITIFILFMERTGHVILTLHLDALVGLERTLRGSDTCRLLRSPHNER